jgi:hypothetical protein
MPKGRRLVIATGGENDSALTMFDVSDLENANAQFPLQFVIQTQCDLGDWHTDSRTDIPLYGPSIIRPTFTKAVGNDDSRGYSHGDDDSGANGSVVKP